MPDWFVAFVRVAPSNTNARASSRRTCAPSRFLAAIARRFQRWNDAITAAVELQAEYAGWLDALPDNQQDSALAEALRAIVELDLSELQAVEPPRGFGRD